MKGDENHMTDKNKTGLNGQGSNQQGNNKCDYLGCKANTVVNIPSNNGTNLVYKACLDH